MARLMVRMPATVEELSGVHVDDAHDQRPRQLETRKAKRPGPWRPGRSELRL